MRVSYKPAIPVLVEWLQRAEDEVPSAQRAKFREGLVRALTVRQARGTAGLPLLREFRRADATPDYRWAVGNALEVTSVDEDFGQLAELAADRSFGADRQMAVLALGRMSDPRAVGILIGLLDDETVVGHALMALGRLRAGEAREAIEQRLEHPKPWVRKEAAKALAKLGG